MSGKLGRAALLVALVLVVAGAVGASATDARGSNRFSGCRNTATGTLDQVKPGAQPMGGACGADEVKISWNKEGVPGVSGYERVQETIATPASLVTMTADCPAGKKVVGGGHYLVSAAGYAVESYPFDDDTWLVKVQKTSGASPWGVSVFAICVSALP